MVKIWTPGQDLQVRGPDLQVLRGTTRVGPVQGQRDSYIEVRKLRTGACRHQSPLPKDAGSREQNEIGTQGKCNQASQQDPSPHPIEERMDRIGRTRGGKETINTTNHNHPGTNGGKYKVTTVRKEVQTTSDQETRTDKGSCRPSTSYQGLDKTTSTIDDGVSGSDVSKPVPSRTIGQARPTSRQATSDVPRDRGTNRRCTGNHTDSTHRCNIPVKEDFCREHSSSTGTQEDNGGSHGCYQHPHPVEDKVSYNGPFQGNRGFSHTVCPHQ